MKIDDITKSITDKLGKDESGKIADDIAKLMTLETSRIKELEKRNTEIEKLKKDKEMLINANGELLQQISSENEAILKPQVEEKEELKHIDMRDCFDEKGRFKTRF